MCVCVWMWVCARRCVHVYPRVCIHTCSLIISFSRNDAPFLATNIAVSFTMLLQVENGSVDRRFVSLSVCVYIHICAVCTYVQCVHMCSVYISAVRTYVCVVCTYICAVCTYV